MSITIWHLVQECQLKKTDHYSAGLEWETCMAGVVPSPRTGLMTS